MISIESPLISVCIPTRGRFEELRACLQEFNRLRSEISPSYSIEVVVSVSGQIPENVVLGGPDYPVDVWVHQPEIIHVGPNLLSALGLARGEYVLFMGDDDLPTPSLFTSLESLQESEQSTPAFIELNAPEHSEARMLGHRAAIMRAGQLPGILLGREESTEALVEALEIKPDSIYPQVWMCLRTLPGSSPSLLGPGARLGIGSMEGVLASRPSCLGVSERIQWLVLARHRGYVSLRVSLEVALNLMSWSFHEVPLVQRSSSWARALRMLSSSWSSVVRGSFALIVAQPLAQLVGRGGTE